MSNEKRDPAPLLSTLPERLRGIYRLGVNDGADLLNGSDTFTRQFETPPIQKAAADRIEELEAALKPFAEAAKHIPTDIEDFKIVAFVPGGSHAASFNRMREGLTAGAFRAIAKASQEPQDNG